MQKLDQERITAMQKVELWEPVAGFPYEVSTDGRVRRTETGRLLVPMRCGHKRKHYSTVCLGKGIQRKVHHLVLIAFVGPRPSGLFGLHEDDDTWNNALDNLYWGTPVQNAWDCAVRHNRLTKEQAAELVERRRAGERGVDLAREYGVSQQTVCDIYKGRSITYEVRL